MPGRPQPQPEEKWGVLERFRVRPEWKDRVLDEDPAFLTRLVEQRAPLVDGGAFILGPFLLPHRDGEWWTALWQFPNRDAADALRRAHEEPRWRDYLESELFEGSKYDPAFGLPGF